MTNKMRDAICAVIMLAFGAAMIVLARDIPHKIESDVGSAYVPTFIGICIVAVAAAKLILTFVKKSPAAKEKIKFDQDALGGFGTIALMVVYMLMFEPVGFIVSSALYLFVQMVLLSNKQNRNPILFAVIAIALPVAVDALFVYAIHMPLPVGILGF